MADTITTTFPTIASTEEWFMLLERFREREDQVRAELAGLNAERRRLPMAKIDKDYAFEGSGGPARLVDLFNAQPQLVMYHFMYAPEWEQGCPGCTGYANGIGETSQIRQQDTEFVMVSRAPFAKLEAWKAQHGWTMPWYSCGPDFSAEMNALPNGHDVPTINVFVRDDQGNVYRSYYTNGAALETTMGQKGLLDLTPRGADALG